MPILTRPVREQLEHDRVIRLLQARYKRKHDVIINPGAEQNQSVTVGELAVFPDLILLAERGKKLEGTVEVETGESVNQLEALAEWGVFSKLKVPLHLYVPPTAVDTARRLCTEHQIPVAEVWTYHLQFDQARFTMVHRSPDAPAPKPSTAFAKATAGKPAIAKPAAKPAVKAATAKPKAKPAAKAKVAKPTLRQAQGRPERSRGAKAKSKPAAKAKSKPAKGKKAKR